MDRELLDVYRGCWCRLGAAAEAGVGGGWRIPVLATVRGGELRQRSVVLRRVDPECGQFWIHTDVRSAKVSDIRQCSRVSLLFYDAATETQLCVSGEAQVLTGGAEVDWLWEHSAASSLRMYLAPGVPGTCCESGDSNLPAEVRGRIPDREELSAGLVNFAGIRVRLLRMEWLQLSRGGNRRAMYERSESGALAGWWVLP